MLSNEDITLVSNLIDLEFYRFKRYKVPATVTIFESKCGDVFETITDKMRKTDICQYIDDSRFVILLSHTEAHEANQAIAKFLTYLNKECLSSIFVGYTEINGMDMSSRSVVKRANAALVSALKTQNKNVIQV